MRAPTRCCRNWCSWSRISTCSPPPAPKRRPTRNWRCARCPEAARPRPTASSMSPRSPDRPGIDPTNSRNSARHGDGNLSALRAGPELRAGADRGRFLGDAPLGLWRHDARPHRQGTAAGRGRGGPDRRPAPPDPGQARRGGASGAAGHQQRPDSGSRHQSAGRSQRGVSVMSLERTRRNLLALASVIAPLAGLIVWLIADPASAQSFNLDLNRAGGSSTSQIIQLFALLTVLSIAPGILVMVTAFIRIAVVLSFLRTAMGIQQTPPNSVMMSLALFLTAFIMAPTMQEAYTNGIAPLVANEIDEMEAFDQSIKPFHAFMMQHVREADLILFADIAKVGAVKAPEDTPLQVLIPAFMISELRRGFEIGFLLFLPFLIIDMVVASILMSMGMMMLPPAAVAMPFKIIFFVLVDGWHLISGTLVQSFGAIS